MRTGIPFLMDIPILGYALLQHALAVDTRRSCSWSSRRRSSIRIASASRATCCRLLPDTTLPTREVLEEAQSAGHPADAGPPSQHPVAEMLVTQRKAIIVAGAAGPESRSECRSAAVRLRASAIGAEPDGAAAARFATEPFDLVILPLQDMGAVELATLEREVAARPARRW